jgi:hypothetical protein
MSSEQTRANLEEQAKKAARGKSRARIKFTGQITTEEAYEAENDRLQLEAEKQARKAERMMNKEINDDNKELLRQWNKEARHEALIEKAITKEIALAEKVRLRDLKVQQVANAKAEKARLVSIAKVNKALQQEEIRFEKEQRVLEKRREEELRDANVMAEKVAKGTKRKATTTRKAPAKKTKVRK